MRCGSLSRNVDKNSASYHSRSIFSGHRENDESAVSCNASDNELLVQVPVVLPYLLMGGTDSKHLAHLSTSGILRFAPMILNLKAGDIGRIHGIDERIEVSTYKQAICVYKGISRRFGEGVWTL